MWVNNWLTVEGSLVCCKDNSSFLACLARSVSSQQILLNSSISCQSLAWSSWKSPLFLHSNSPHKLILSLWAWSAHRRAWCSWHRWIQILDSRFLISNSPHKLIFSLWTWSAHWFAWCNCNQWDSSSHESHKELLMNFISVPIFWFPYQLQLQIVFSKLPFSLERQIQQAFHSRYLLRFCLSDEVRTPFESWSLFPLNTDSSTRATGLLPRTRSPVLKNEPAIESLPRTSSPVLRTEPKIQQHWNRACCRMLAAACYESLRKMV